MFLFDTSDFLDTAERAKIAPLVWVEELKGKTPLSVLNNLASTISPPYCLLESAGGNSELAQHSFLAFQPFLIFISKNGNNTVREYGKKSYISSCSNPFQALRELLDKYMPRQKISIKLPFWGGAMGYISYDSGRYLERLPNIARDDLAIPDMVFFFPRLLLVFDHKESLFYVVINQIVDDDPFFSYKAAYDQLNKTLSLIKDNTGKKLPAAPFPSVKVDSNLNRDEFEAIVRRTIEYIYAGDVYQVNLSQRLRVPFSEHPFILYQRLRDINPSPFAAYLDLGNFQLVSSSPERLVMLRGEEATTRPIAGTRPRGDDDKEEKKLSEHLLLDIKERAEHIMLVDLERNDLGKICTYGTVRANELMVLERYSHVIHIVSNIKGELSKGKDQFDLIQAMFPGGTITGCPKVRCMEIIEELEPVRRGPYTGSIGYFGFNGEMDMNIIIRTILLKKPFAFAQVGAGIVADSKPEREYFETLHKAEAMLKALNATSYPLFSETKKVFL